MAAASLCAGLGVKGSRESCSWRLHSKEKPRTSFMTHWGPRTGSESRYISCCQAVYTVGHLNSSWSEKYCDAVLPVRLFTDNLGRENNHHLYNCFCHQDWCSNHLLCCTELDPSLRPYSLYFHWLTANVSLCAKLWFLFNGFCWDSWFNRAASTNISAEKQLAAVNMSETNTGEFFLRALWGQRHHGRLNRWLQAKWKSSVWHFTSSRRHWWDSYLTSSVHLRTDVLSVVLLYLHALCSWEIWDVAQLSVCAPFVPAMVCMSTCQ